MPIHISVWYSTADIEPETLGDLPNIFLSDDPRPAKQQANERYRHGGGWQQQQGWKFNKVTKQISYPGDAPLSWLAMTALPLSHEIVALYPHDYVIIVRDGDGSFEVARMD